MSARYRLYREGQPIWFSILARIADSLASLSLAVTLIFTLAGTLAFATFVEARYGTACVQFFVYQTWWFDALLVLLACNILFAAMVRYPWKRYQTGFVITHIGLLTLIGGAALSRLYGIDSQVMVFEDQSSKWAWGDNHKITLRELDANGSASNLGGDKRDRETTITFRGGPMNWSDYARKFTFAAPFRDDKLDTWAKLGRSIVQGASGVLFSMPMRHGKGDTIFERDDIKVRVLDYYSDSSEEGPLALRVGGSVLKKTVVNEEDGTSKEVAEPAMWESVPSLSTTEVADKESFPLGVGGKQFVGGGFFTFSLASSQDQVNAFLDSAPKSPLGEKGLVVLGGMGKKIEFDVAEKVGKGRFAFEGTPYEVEVVDYFPVGMPRAQRGQRIEFIGQDGATTPDNPLVNLKIFKDGKEVGRLALLSEAPELNVHDYANGIFGDYWFDQSGRSREDRMSRQISSRIEVLGAPDHKLYYRYWNLKEVVASGELPTQGSEADAIDAFKMPFAQLKMYVERYTPEGKPGLVPVPVDFRRDAPVAQTRPAVHLEITKKGAAAGEVQRRWLRAASPDDPTILQPEDRLIVSGAKRDYELTMLLDAIDIGFRVRLDKFERKLDPGTSQPSHYSSTIDLLDRENSREIRYLKKGSLWPTQLKIPAVDPGAAIAIDELRGDIYVPDSKKGVIYRIESGEDKDDRQPRISAFNDRVQGEVVALALTGKSRKLVWIEKSGPRGEAALMAQSLTDGGAERLHQFPIAPRCFAVDSDGAVAYFIDPATGELQQLDLATKQTMLVAPGFADATAMLVQSGKAQTDIYVADYKAGEVIQVRDGESKSLIRLPSEQSPISLAIAPEGDALLVGVSVETPRLANSSKPPPHRNPDAIVSIDLKSKSQKTVTNSRVYTPSAIAADSQSGRVYWVQTASLGESMWITMNAPIDVNDPRSGRAYRVFQESYGGPWLPGSRDFDAIVPPSSDKDELYMSILSVNYDPGRGIRSAGCILVILGVAVMFYMRAYFFKPRPRITPPLPTRSARPRTAVVSEAVEA
jgi:hypothetical protein